MNLHTLPSPAQHQQIVMLLPWYLNQSLEHNEHQLVKSHLRSCIQCRRELVSLRELAAAMQQASDLELAAEASFTGLRGKLHKPQPFHTQLTVAADNTHLNDNHPGTSNTAVNYKRRFMRFNTRSVTRFAIAASLLLTMAPLTIQYFRSQDSADYYTLSTAKPNSPTGLKLRVVFSKSLAEDDINSLLEQIHGQRIDGPNSAGAYTVRLDTDKNSPELTAAIAMLRNRQDVMLAEPVLQP